MAPAGVRASTSSPYHVHSQPSSQSAGGGEKSDMLKGLQDVYWSDEEEEDPECPLCMEEMDLSDINFKPCPCGYQICRFCHHHILANLNKRCPACRRQYTEEGIEFIPVGAEEIKRLTALKRNKAKTNKELEALGRRHLKDVRVVVKNMVYVVGMGVGQEGRSDEQLATLRSNDYFGQYGKISKLVLHKRPPSSAPAPSSSSSSGPPPPNVGIYISYLRREDAARAISALDGFPSPSAPGQVLRASFGTAKYCESWLRGVKCDNLNCLGLHDWGDERDCFTKEDLSTLKHTLKGTEHLQKPVIVSRPVVKKVEEVPDASALPRTASWASRPGTGLASLPPNPTLPAPPGLKAQTPIPAPSQPQPVPSRLQPKPKPVTSSPAPSSSTPQQVTILAKPTPVKSSSKTTTATASSSTSAPSVGSSSRPGTPASGTTTAKASIGIVSSTTNRPTPTSTPTSAVPTTIITTLPTPSPTVSSPAPPPPPPGLGLPSFNQQPPPPSLEPIPAHLQSPYQPSTQTQALVDEITARREAPGPPAFTSSPFPDFEHMLSTIGDGQFAFNLNLEQQKGSSSSRSKHAEPSMLSPSAFSPFGYGGGSSSPFGLLSSESLVATPYAGSFDPWGDSPRPAAPADPDMLDEQAGGKKSRFDFARRKTSTHHFGGGSPSPVGRSLGLPPVEGDSRRGSVDSDGLMMKENGGRFGREPSGRITPTPSATTSTDQSSYLWAGSNNHHDPPPHQHPQQHQQQQQSRSSNNSSPAPFGRHPPPGLPSSSGGPGHLARQASSNSSNFPSSSAPPPPGLGLKSPLQGQQPQQLHHQQPGGAGNWIHQIPQQQQQQQGSIGGDASRMAFARQQQGYANGGGDRGNQAQALKDMLGVGGGMGSGMGGMGMGMGGGMGAGGAEHNHMPFQDPAIMSFRSSQQQQQQQQQHQYSNNAQQQHGSSNNNQFSSELGMHGVGGTTDPSSLGAFAAFASQSLNVGNARLLQQIQHQQQQQGYYGVQQGGQGGRGPSPSPPLVSDATTRQEANVFDFPPLPPGLPRPATATSTSTASTHATRFISNQTTPAQKTPSSPANPFTPSDSESSSNSTPLRPTDVQIAVQSATPNFSTGSPGPEWSNVWGESPSRSRSSLLGAQGWTPGHERRLSLEAIEGRMSKEEEERVEELVGELDDEEEMEEGLRAEEEEVEREVDLAVVEEPIVVVEKVIVQPEQEEEPVKKEVVASTSKDVSSSTPTSSPELPAFVAPTPHPDEVRAAVRAASADKPAPVTISLRSKPLAVPTPPPVEKAVVVEKTPTSTLKSASVKSTPASTRPGTPTKAGKGTPKQQLKAATAIVAEPSPTKTPKLVAKSSSSSVVAAAKVQQVNTSPPPPPPPAAPVFVEQAPLLSRQTKKAKVPKVKKTQEVEKENSPSPDGDEPSSTTTDDGDATNTTTSDQQQPAPLGPSSCGANEILVPSTTLDDLPPTKPIASLPELLHQISYLIDCNSLAFFSPSLPSISLPSSSTEPANQTDNQDPSTPLSSQTLALALSALSSSNPTVSMEEAVSSFHVLLSLLTGRIAGVLGALPTGCRGGVSGRFEGMFGEGGEGVQTDGFDELDDDDEEDEDEHGLEGEIAGGGGGRRGGGGGDEVERLRGALGRRASYLAKQLGRLEELHREINVIALDSLVPRFAAIAPSTSDFATASSAEIEAELAHARRAVEETTRELEIVMDENAKVFGEMGGR